jgi:hypothetical protein
MKIFFALLLMFSVSNTSAQTLISGVVKDTNNEPLPFINVYFKNSKVGTTTDVNGLFEINTNQNLKTLIFSSVGFKTVEYNLKSNRDFNIKIILEDGESLQEVVVVSKPKKRLKKKENPAYRIMQEIWERKQKNSLKTLDFLQYQKYEILEVNLNKIDTVFMGKLLGEEKSTIISTLKKEEKSERYNIPIFMTEKYDEIYESRKLNENKTVRVAERNTGIAPEGVAFDKLSVTFKEFNIYDNTINVLDKFFTSPLASDGFSVYDYVLHDSIVKNDRKYYNIYFFPRVNGDLVFKGNFQVDAELYAINEIKYYTDGETNINLVRGLSIIKEFELMNNEYYVLKQSDFEGEFTLLSSSNENEKGISVSNKFIYQNYLLNLPIELPFYQDIQVQTYANEFNVDDSFWKEKNLVSDYVHETHAVIKKLQGNKKIKSINNLINIASTGHFNLYKNIQMGNLWLLFNRNDVEGTRFRISFRNFKSKDDKWRVNNYFAYGTKDQRLKYGAEVKFLVYPKKRTTLGLSYMDDYEQVSARILEDNELLLRNFGVGALVVRGKNYTLLHNKRASVQFQHEFSSNLNLTTAVIHQDVVSADPINFNIGYLDENNIIQNRVNGFSSSVTLSFTPGRINYGFGIERKHNRKNYATYLVRYTKGFEGITSHDFDYHRIQASMRKAFDLGKFGVLNSYLEGSKLFGKVPIALMTPINANQTYGVVNSTFSLLNYYDLMADQYIMGQFDYHLNGLIFNRIPLLRKLKIREVLFYRAVYGTISDKNIAINQSNILYVAPDSKPYQEFGFGIDNIGFENIRPLRIDFVWRNDYKFQNIHNKTPKFGVLVGVKVDF